MDKFEHEIQSAFIAEARKIPGAEMIHAIPNAVPVRTGGMGKEAAKLTRIIAQKHMTREGRLPGVLDVFNPNPVFTLDEDSLGKFISTTQFHGLYMEFKRPGMIINGKKKPAGTLKPEQAYFIMYAVNHGYAVAVCHSVQQGIATLKDYLQGRHDNAYSVELAIARIAKEGRRIARLKPNAH